MSVIPFNTVEPAAGPITGGATPPAELVPLADLMRLLSDRTRVRLLFELSAGERNVTHLCRSLGLPQPTASHHLALLAAAGLLSRRRAGKSVFYRLGPNARATVDGLEVGAGGPRVLVTRRSGPTGPSRRSRPRHPAPAGRRPPWR